MNFHKDSWKSGFFVIWMVIMIFFLSIRKQQKLKVAALEDRVVQLEKVQDIIGCWDGIVQGCQN